MTSRVVEETIEPQKSELGFLHDKQTKSFYFEKFCKNLVFVTLFISKSSATDHKKIWFCNPSETNEKKNVFQKLFILFYRF